MLLCIEILNLSKILMVLWKNSTLAMVRKNLAVLYANLAVVNVYENSVWPYLFCSKNLALLYARTLQASYKNHEAFHASILTALLNARAMQPFLQNLAQCSNGRTLITAFYKRTLHCHTQDSSILHNFV